MLKLRYRIKVLKILNLHGWQLAFIRGTLRIYSWSDPVPGIMEKGR